MPIVALVIAIVLLFVLMMAFKFNAFFSLIITAIVVGIMMGMPLLDIVSSIESGLGGTLGHMAIIVGFGVILGKFVADGGGAHRIATTMINKFGDKVDWAMCFIALILGIVLFWEVSFVLLIPIVYTVVSEAKVSLMKVAIPFLSSIGAAHCFLPPHPGVVTVAGILEADIGKLMAYGLILAIPVCIIMGPIFAKMYSHWSQPIPEGLVTVKEFKEEELPSFGMSVFISLLPVILILMGSLVDKIFAEDNAVYTILNFIGNSDVALFISVLVALWYFGLRGKRRSMSEMMKTSDDALRTIATIVFIIGGGGAFKQVILDSGMADYIADLTTGWDISPILLAWLIAAIIKMAVGSATVTVMTTAAIVLPIMAATGGSPELITLAICSGSTFGGPPSDAAFWLVKEYLNLSVGQMVKFWCVNSTGTSVLGLLGVLALSTVVV